MLNFPGGRFKNPSIGIGHHGRNDLTSYVMKVYVTQFFKLRTSEVDSPTTSEVLALSEMKQFMRIKR